MQLNELAEQAVAVGGGVSVIGGAVLWLFREKVGVWVDRRVEAKLRPLTKGMADMEVRVTHIERESTVTAKAVEQIAKGIEDHMTRLTVSMTAMSVEVVSQGKEIAKIAGALEAMDPRR